MFLCFYRTAHLWTLFYLYFIPLLYIKADPFFKLQLQTVNTGFLFQNFRFDRDLFQFRSRACTGVILIHQSLRRCRFGPEFVSESFRSGFCIGVVLTRGLHRCRFDQEFASVSFRSRVCIGVVSIWSLHRCHFGPEFRSYFLLAFLYSFHCCDILLLS